MEKEMGGVKIYFAGSIKGSDTGKEDYPKIITYLKIFSTVLSEHLNWTGKNKSQESLGPKEIFLQDTGFIDKADIVVAEITGSSHGVGRELAYAQYNAKISIIALAKSETRISWMILGNPYITVVEYDDLETLFESGTVEKMVNDLVGNFSEQGQKL